MNIDLIVTIVLLSVFYWLGTRDGKKRKQALLVKCNNCKKTMKIYETFKMDIRYNWECECGNKVVGGFVNAK